MDLCVEDGTSEPQRCGSQCWTCLNNALSSVTHPSSTSNVGPTARIFSRYVDVVPVGQWVVLPETDGRLLVVVLNSQQDLVSLISSCTGNVSLSVRDRILCTSRQKIAVF
jgi:hypothetical protein